MQPVRLCCDYRNCSEDAQDEETRSHCEKIRYMIYIMEKIKPHQRWRQALVIPRSLVQYGLMSPIQVLPGAPASTNLNPACHKYKTVSQIQDSVTNTRKCHIYKTVSPCDVINISQIMSIPSLQQFFRVNGFFCISTREGCLCRGVLSSLSIESKGFLCDQSDVSCWTSRTLVFLLLFSICTFFAYFGPPICV